MTNFYKPYNLQSVYICSELINEGSNKLYCCNYRNNKHLLYEVLENRIYFSFDSDLALVEKIHKIYNPFKVT